MTTTKNAGDVVEPDMDRAAVRVTRNMNSRTSVDDPHTSECRPCTCVHCTFGRNLLVTKQNLAGDLAGHMFGHLVSTDLARDILTTFVIDGVVQVFEGVIPQDEQVSDAPLDPYSEDVQRALGQAFEAAAAHDCIRSRPENNVPEKRSPLPDKEEEKEKIYSVRWRTLPKVPFREVELVSFLNEITDHAFAIAKPHLRPATTKLGLRHRFVAPEDKRHALPLAYDPDEKDMRPGFLLLPIEAFSGGSKTVDQKYVNLTAARLVGESNEDFVEGLERTLRYAHGLKCAQPWVYYVLGMTFSPDVAIFSRGDPSDWEHLALMLWDGRGCIEFIRILLGLALADGVDLGQNPFVELRFEERTFQLADPTRHCVSSDAESSTTDSYLDSTSSGDAMSATSNLSSCHSAPAIPYEEDDGEESSRLKRHKIFETIEGTRNEFEDLQVHSHIQLPPCGRPKCWH